MSNTQNWVAMGYIKGAFGIKGWIKVQSDTEYTDSLLDYPQWRLSKGKKHILARDAAALLRGYTIEVPREQFEPTEEGEYYWADLIGMAVKNRDGINLGEVINLMETGAHDILVVRGEHGEKLIPFVDQFIDSVDNENRQITCDWGLDY